MQNIIKNTKPVNRTAAKVVKPGISYDFENNQPHHFVSNVKTTQQRILDDSFTKEPGYIDFTGKKIGKLTVIGLAKIPKNNRGLAWIVRCSCGNFEHRRNKSLKRIKPIENEFDEECCIECKDLNRLKKIRQAKEANMQYQEYCEARLPRKEKNK